MPESSISNLNSFIQQKRQGEFEELVLSIPDDRSFQNFVADGKVESIETFDQIEDYQKYNGFDSFIRGQKVEIRGGGRKLAEGKITRSDLNLGGTGSIRFDHNRLPEFTGSYSLDSAYPEIAKNTPDDVFTLRDMAQHFNIKSLTITPVQEDKEQDPTEPDIPEGEEPEDSQREMNPLVIYAIVAILAYVTAR